MAMGSWLVATGLQFSHMSFCSHLRCSTDWHFHLPTKNNNGGISLYHWRTAKENQRVKSRFKQPSQSESPRRASRFKHPVQREKAKWAPTHGEKNKRASQESSPAHSRTRSAKAELGNGPAVNRPKKRLAKTVIEALTERIHKKNWKDALKVFGMLREQPWYEPNANTYKKLLVLLGRCGQHEEAFSLFQMMLEEGCDLNVEVYTALISAYSRSGLFDKAFAILDEMKRIPHCQPDVFTYSILIKYCVDGSQFDQVDRLLAEMSGRGIMPNTVTRNILISGYGKAGMFEKMGNVLSQMLASDICKPDEWTMNAILRVFANRGQIEIMEKWYEKFQRYGIQPDITTFNILIDSYGKERLYDKMTAVMEYMQKSCVSWTTDTYNVVIDAFGWAGEIQQMEYVFNQMRSESVKPDSTTFCCLISAYSKSGIFDQITKIVSYVENSDVIPDTPFFNAVIDAYQRAGDLTKMEKAFQQMKDRGCVPDEVTFRAMREAYLRAHLPEKVQELEQKIKEHGITMFEGTFQ